MNPKGDDVFVVKLNKFFFGRRCRKSNEVKSTARFLFSARQEQSSFTAKFAIRRERSGKYDTTPEMKTNPESGGHSFGTRQGTYLLSRLPPDVREAAVSIHLHVAHSAVGSGSPDLGLHGS